MSSDEIVLNKFNALPNNRQELLLTTAAMIENEDDKELCICNAKMMKFTDEDMPFLLKIMVAKLIIRKMNIPNVKHGDMEAMLLAKSYPKNIGMPRELYLDWPRDTVTLEMLKKKVIIAQVVLELCVTKQKKHSVAHNPEILNEYEARIKFKNSILRLANVTKEKAIKASKKMSIDEIVQKIAADIHNNEERYISVRCADIFEAVFLIKAAIREMKQLRRTIQFRMINIIKIAKKDETGSLKPTQKRLLFGVEIKAPAMYTDYSELLDTSLSVQEDLQETLNILNGTKVELISRTFATSQTFGSLCTEAKYQRLKDSNRRKRVHHYKMQQLIEQMPQKLLTIMYKDFDIKYIKIEYKRRQRPVYLDVLQYIHKKFNVNIETMDLSKIIDRCWGFPLENFFFTRLDCNVLGDKFYYGFQVVGSYLTYKEATNLDATNRLCQKIVAVSKPIRDHKDIVICTPFINDKGDGVIGGWKRFSIYRWGLGNEYEKLRQRET
eukprot:535399_1